MATSVRVLALDYVKDLERAIDLQDWELVKEISDDLKSFCDAFL